MGLPLTPSPNAGEPDKEHAPESGGAVPGPPLPFFPKFHRGGILLLPVLILDDEPAIRSYIRTIAGKEHYRYVCPAVPQTDRAREMDEIFGPYCWVEVW